MDPDEEDVVAIGAACNTTNNAKGAVFIFTRSGTTWTQQKKLLGESDGDLMTDVGISGNTVIGGAWGEDTGGSGAGAGFIFIGG
jgi:hypothetical protein